MQSRFSLPALGSRQLCPHLALAPSRRQNCERIRFWSDAPQFVVLHYNSPSTLTGTLVSLGSQQVAPCYVWGTSMVSTLLGRTTPGPACPSSHPPLLWELKGKIPHLQPLKSDAPFQNIASGAQGSFKFILVPSAWGPSNT